jgi:hypothetical protein
MPHRPDYTVEAAPQSAKDIVARFGGGWAVAEQDKFKTWRWATEQRAILVVTNTSSKSLQVQLGFRISSLIRRDLRLSVPGATIWSGAIDRRPALASILTPSMNLPPGDTEVTFSTPQAPVSPGTDDPRSLTFRVTGLVIKGTPAQ